MGSFLNVVIYQLEKKKRKDLGGRSFCPSCGHTLASIDLVPVFSWLFLQGRCRYCQGRISAQYPLVELATAMIFMLLGWHFEISGLTLYSLVSLVFWLYFAASMFVIFVYDLKHLIIPDRIIYPALILGIIYSIVVSILQNDWHIFLESILSGLAAGVFFYMLAAVSQGKWMGGGDIKLVTLMGLLLTWPGIIFSLYIGFVAGAIVGVSLIILGMKHYSSRIPFGPFLILGTFLSLFFSEQFLNFYARIFL